MGLSEKNLSQVCSCRAALGLNVKDVQEHVPIAQDGLIIEAGEVGAEVFRKRARNCRPWVRSLIHSPGAVTHSPAEIIAA